MRLLQWDNGEISLTDPLLNDKLPKYAILSHTWLPDNDQEVTFQDLKSGSGKSKPGFQKICFCGEQATKDGLRYFWVDTCCINKFDSSEVQMSINSMFRWYQKAEKCYVFLSDVSVAEDATENISHVDFVPAFRSSRWWTRGWTLQELLAPRSVEFFSYNHKRLGDKFSLDGLINDITKIPIKALRDFGISKVDVDQCISWVLKRNTRYEEDLAYSLWGMFGVSLPVLYGEGRKRAFRRLRQGAESNERETAIQELTDRLEVRHRLVLCVSKGLQTSQVAREYNDRWKGHYQDGHIFWKNTKNFGGFEQAYKEIAEELAIPVSEHHRPNYLILVRDWLNELANGPWLLILDNFDNPNLFFEPQVSSNVPNQLRISKFLPQDPQTGHQEAAILITALDSSSAVKILRLNRSILKNEQLDETKSKLLNSLRDSNMNTSRNQIENNHAETFSWIFDPEGQRPWDSFPEWLSGDSSEIYWIRGKAGSGKSTLMKFLVEADETKTYLNRSAPGHMVYSYFIWNSGSTMQRSLKGLLSSLLYQIFDEDSKIMAEALRTCPHISKAQNTNDWSIESLRSFLSSSLAFHQQPVCIFLDGLDEIASEQDSSELQGPYNLLHFIKYVLSSSKGNTKICVSSRPEPAFISELQNFPKLQFQDLTKGDVESYTRDFIRIKCSFDFEDVTEETFVDEVVRKADGVFLWVSLALQSLQRGLSSGDRPEELFNRLQKLPRRLEKLYDNIMRLLHCRTLELEDFFQNATPSYAILSHTWEKEELDCHEILNINGSHEHAKKKTGFRKITNCCKQAAEDGFEYVWIDTCCIDKTSSAELSEAINSMYVWYSNAAICYAYLVDVPLPSDPPSSSSLESSSDKVKRYSKFTASRWWTRGWTLQELLAPTSVRFFSQDWKLIGTKDFLSDLIARVTGIDAATLQGRPVAEESIAKRMSWASKRVTTRVEDIAYCLIGIFGVNLPLLYGEGEKAFVRLQEEIMKSSDDQSLFAWQVNENTENVARQSSIKLFKTDAENNKVEDLLTQRQFGPQNQLSLQDLGGFLAKSPAAFQYAGSIVPYRNWEISTPYSMTNQGLRIQLEILYLDAKDYLAILQCHYKDNFLGPLGIYIKPIVSDSGDQFARDLSHRQPVVVIPNHVSTAVLRTVYIRQEVLLPSSRDYDRTNHFLIRRLPGPEYPLVVVYPEEHWNDSQKILRPPDGRGVLLFASMPGSRTPFAVIIQTNIKSNKSSQSCYCCKVVVDDERISNHDPARWGSLLKATGERYMVEEMSGLDEHTAHAELSDQDARYKHKITAKISKETFLGQEMYVVDVSINTTTLKFSSFFATDFLSTKEGKTAKNTKYERFPVRTYEPPEIAL
ncbi:hypothetical protein HYALB_00009213 [Hymenoscyphus albidus]|uniref:NACHT domain-containing protein n=1 Tax=Hymenoscyphus albidus TaxID=595503 RepID=A0A9N9Q1D3_9HELO|nr:hypothetical protein HYALB_00009213 [Hymenoscyphus albidus]